MDMLLCSENWYGITIAYFFAFCKSYGEKGGGTTGKNAHMFAVMVRKLGFMAKKITIRFLRTAGFQIPVEPVMMVMMIV